MSRDDRLVEDAAVLGLLEVADTLHAPHLLDAEVAQVLLRRHAVP